MEKKFRDLLVNSENEANVLIYGVPFDGNCSVSSGSQKAPDKLRELSWWLPPYSMDGKPLNHIKIFDNGNFNICSFEDINKCADIINKKSLILIFGGDHSISIPFQKEFIEKCHKENKEPVILHIDAHCDICDEYLESKYSHACTVRRALDNGLKRENLFMIGIREFEKDGYTQLIENGTNGVHLFKASDVLENGLDKFFKELNAKNNDKYSLYVSFDIDSLDASYVPGTGTPETCGLTPFILKKILSFVAGFKNICCFDLVEVAPPLDSNDITSWTAIKLVYEFFAEYKPCK